MDEQSQNPGQAGTSAGSSSFRDWSAILDLMPGAPRKLRVGGEYHLNQRCGGVRLEEAVPPGFNPRILLLNLVDEDGEGGDWVIVRGEFEAAEGQYDSVSVNDSDGESHHVEVQEVH
jgi:hypothetical protein